MSKGTLTEDRKGAKNKMSNHFVYRADLQLLRGFSVLLVFLYHLKVPGFENGFLGVDIFFVLSGFLMAILAEKVSPSEFYAKRLKRLLPAYFVVVLVSTVAVIALTIPVDSNQRLDRIFYDLVGLSNFAFWAENSYFSNSEFKPLLNFWSLAVELQFYLLAPFLLPFLHKRKFILILVIATSFLLSMALITVSPKTSFYMLPTRLWEFLFGAFAAWFAVKNGQNKFTSALVFIAVCILLAVIFFYPLVQDSLSILTAHPSVAALIVVLSTTTIIALGLDKLLSTDTKFAKILIRIGDYSYSIYLVHFPIMVLVNYAQFGGTRLGFNSISHLLTIIALTIISSFFLYNCVEKIRYSKRATVPLFGLTSACLLMGIFGSSLNKLGYSQNEILVFQAWEDRAYYRCGKLKRILNPTSKVCLIGNDLNGDRVLLLGNSHADSIKIAFKETMEDNGLATFFYVANNPLMSSTHNAELVKNEVISNEITNVVIHYTPSFYDNANNIARITNFVEMMKSENISVLFIAPVPVYEHHIPKTMLELLNKQSSEISLTNLDVYMISSASFEKFINGNNVSSENVFYPHTIFCPENECAYQIKGVPYYFDKHHLTLTGATQLHPIFNKIGLQISSKN